ncbi:uncharacterized protein I303_107204 [Kwoniella dejecticola CBS 10117]|uniref:ATP-dependent DNA helicase II subunit 1 n=1 Tax=Kwoniella dejecticola CBS 10117 TaxID=1296121 RepID=A0A1A5ZZ08_9TREE|nr:uncharacterized protein I303_06605 [Kwoniella dejecticola CBS 10117]OBR83046.1 hypothetical protein I303_06605 [Kwoniella dejecticola CBS 10117]
MSSYYGDRARDIASWESLEAADEDDIVDTSEYAYASRDHILFCIDASRSMQTPFPDTTNEDGELVRGKSALHQALEAVVKIQRSKVITGPADSVGVLLWNVDPENTPSSSQASYKPGTQVYQNLRTINAEEIKRIVKLLEKAKDEYDAQKEDDGHKTVQSEILGVTFPPCDKEEELNIADVLVTCNFLFRDAGTNLAGNKRVFLVTDSDYPPGSKMNREPARTVYGDLSSYGISINTFFVDRPNHKFNPTLYWNDILQRGPEDDAPETDAQPDVDGLAELAEVMNDLVIRHAPKRVQFSIPLKFGGKDGDIEIGVSGYAMVSTQGKGQPKLVRMRGQTVEEVQIKSEYTSAETGAVLNENEIAQAFQFGNEATVRNVIEPNWWESDEHQIQQQEIADEVLRLEDGKRDGFIEKDEEEVVEGSNKNGKTSKLDGKDEKPKLVARTRLQFTNDEIAEFKSLGIQPQIKIIGFQFPDHLSFEENLKHSYFIYPNEAQYTGSTRTFAALLKSCVKLEKHALAICRFRTNTQPEFCVLIPQEETFTKDGGQDQPPGFHIIVLPYRDDIRLPPKNMTDNLLATDRQAQLMSNVVKRLRIKAGHYRSEAYPNPSLAYHYAQLQSLAFEEDFDPASSQAQDLDKTFPKWWGMHKAAGEFMLEFNKSIEDDERAIESLKGGTKRSNKVAAGADAGLELNEEDLKDLRGLWKLGKLDKVKVQDIKDYAKFHQISLNGKTKKADLIELLSWHFENEKVDDGGKKKSKK